MANIVGDDGVSGDAARRFARGFDHWAVPDFVDVETVAVLRKRWKVGALSEKRFREAVDDLVALPIGRFASRALVHRAFELRSNVTPYDSLYVALAEALSYTLVTADVRLARAPGIRCNVIVLGG